MSATVLGRQVQVDIALPPAAPSLACRIAGITLVVSGDRAKDAVFNSVQTYRLDYGRKQLAGRTVRLLGWLPYLGTAPYHLLVSNETVQLRESRSVKLTLACPRSVRCLHGDVPGRRGLPTPVLPTRGLTRYLLERSLRHVLAGEHGWVKATAATCPSTRTCDAEFVDPVADARLQLRYAIEGEQRAGCWLGAVIRRKVVPDRARELVDEPAAAPRVGGCVSWTR